MKLRVSTFPFHSIAILPSHGPGESLPEVPLDTEDIVGSGVEHASIGYVSILTVHLQIRVQLGSVK
jgi:hypothetical protein